jgi:hypothetical protein
VNAMLLSLRSAIRSLKEPPPASPSTLDGRRSVRFP